MQNVVFDIRPAMVICHSIYLLQKCLPADHQGYWKHKHPQYHDDDHHFDHHDHCQQDQDDDQDQVKRTQAGRGSCTPTCKWPGCASLAAFSSIL